jgi:hypothetical protein
MKQMAQAVCLGVLGVEQLCNDVQVIPPAARGPSKVADVRSF